MRVAPSSSRVAARDASASPPDFAAHAPLRAQDFTRVLSTGRRRRVGGVTVVTSPGSAGTTRVGLVVGRKVGKAVQRNRAKRRIRHAMRHLDLPPRTDIVVIASRAVVEAPFASLTGWLREVLEEER